MINYWRCHKFFDKIESRIAGRKPPSSWIPNPYLVSVPPGNPWFWCENQLYLLSILSHLAAFAMLLLPYLFVADPVTFDVWRSPILRSSQCFCTCALAVPILRIFKSLLDLCWRSLLSQSGLLWNRILSVGCGREQRNRNLDEVEFDLKSKQ